MHIYKTYIYIHYNILIMYYQILKFTYFLYRNLPKITFIFKYLVMTKGNDNRILFSQVSYFTHIILVFRLNS